MRSSDNEQRGTLSLKASSRTREKGEVGMSQSPAALNLSQKPYKYGVVVVLAADEYFIRVEKNPREVGSSRPVPFIRPGILPLNRHFGPNLPII